MNPRKFLIASLLAAGFGQTSSAQDRLAVISAGGIGDPPDGLFGQQFAREHLFTLAGHSSHSSHSSHRSSSDGGGGGHYSHSSHDSHTSHRSSAYGGYDAPVYAPPAYPNDGGTYPQPPTGSGEGATGGTDNSQRYGFISPQSSSSPGSELKPLTGRSERFRTIVCRVQVALAARDLYAGTIDCSVGPALRHAIRQFQGGHGLDVTGTITPELLDRLMVSTE